MPKAKGKEEVNRGGPHHSNGGIDGVLTLTPHITHSLSSTQCAACLDVYAHLPDLHKVFKDPQESVKQCKALLSVFLCRVALVIQRFYNTHGSDSEALYNECIVQVI